MLIETIELNLANTGLGGLDEVSFLRLFATTQAHALVLGTGRTLRDIENADGVGLYPAFYRTRLRVPPPHRLEQHGTWERVDIGVEIKRFGTMLLESTGVLAAERQLPPDPTMWTPEDLIHFEGSMSFVHDAPSGGDSRVDAPRQGVIADLPTTSIRPAPLEDQRRIRREGVIGGDKRLPLAGQLSHQILIGRDVQPGRAAMFSAFSSLLEVAEQTLLVRQLSPGLDSELVSDLHLLEREIFYFANVRSGDSVTIDTAAAISPASEQQGSAYSGFVGVACLALCSEIYHRATNTLLIAAKTNKILLVPRARANAVQNAQRMLHRHGLPS
jgi:probable biosynthetic protein (TIGR04098 family)